MPTDYPQNREGNIRSEARDEILFGANAFRLNGRQWLAVMFIVMVVMWSVPRFWRYAEPFDVGVDYRIPYALSQDYWLYHRRVDSLHDDALVVLGDSVVWGEYVSRRGTLSHFLNAKTGVNRFVNIGVNGLFPLALWGLAEHYGRPVYDRKVLLHCNLLWISSPEVDLQVAKEQVFNHPRLVPQFVPDIPCYRIPYADRLGIVAERNVEMLSWVDHLQQVYFDQKSIPAWSVMDDGGNPPGFPHSHRIPFVGIGLEIPSEPEQDPQRGEASKRHQPWFESGKRGGIQFEWVTLESSFQWLAFQKLVELLRQRENDLLVVVGPLNQHMLSPENRDLFLSRRHNIVGWLEEKGIQHVAPDLLPSDHYADTSHPLTQGYALLAKRLLENDVFQRWVGEVSP